MPRDEARIFRNTEQIDRVNVTRGGADYEYGGNMCLPVKRNHIMQYIIQCDLELVRSKIDNIVTRVTRRFP